MTELRTRRADEEGRAAEVGVPGPRRPDDRPAPVPDGVELGRFLRLAGLTPAQAVEVAADLLAAVVLRPDPDGVGAPVVAGRILVGADGRVVLTAGPGGPPGAAVATLVEDIARAARLRARRAGPAADPLLAGLDRAVAELLTAGVPAVATALAELAARADRGAVRAEIGALARAIGRRAGAPPVAVRSGDPSIVPSRPAAGRGSRSARRRIGVWFLSILLVAGAVALEYALLRDKVSTDVGVLLDAGRGGAPPSSAPTPDGRPVVPPAPAAAGNVRGVDLRALTGCVSGTPCTVRVLLRVVPGPAPQVITWSYRVVDRCTGAAVAAPGGSATVPAGQDRIAVVGTVPLPSAPGIAVLAVTETPASASSAALLVGSCGPGTG